MLAHSDHTDVATAKQLSFGIPSLNKEMVMHSVTLVCEVKKPLRASGGRERQKQIEGCERYRHEIQNSEPEGTGDRQRWQVLIE